MDGLIFADMMRPYVAEDNDSNAGKKEDDQGNFTAARA